jgi:hypothetical protein
MYAFKFVTILLLILFVQNAKAQQGYFDAPYTRYEADNGILVNATATPKAYKQSDLQSEASDQICVNLSAIDASVEWTLSSPGDGLVARFSVPEGETGIIGIYANGIRVDSLTLTSKWSWESLWLISNPNNGNIKNYNPRMRFDEARVKLSNVIAAGVKLKLVRESGNIHIDFVELELVAPQVPMPAGAVVYSGDGSTLQAFIDANGGKTIFLPAGKYNVNRETYFGVNNTTLQGAGMWFTQINFTSLNYNQGGLKANASNISFSDLYLTTDQSSRSNSYKSVSGVFTSGSIIRNIWAVHFECGAWIGQYNTGNIIYADGFTVSDCRFRNNYADGINLCRGTRNAIVEHCSFRNNGDDDMAIWSADGLECQNNTFRYNTSENCWRASGCAIYGGSNNKAHHLLIKDNLEAGLRANNTFAGVGFNSAGLQEFSDITIIGCGTNNDLWNNPIGAIDINYNSVAGTSVQNIKFSSIDVIDSKNNAIYVYKTGGGSFHNIVFENININGTGKEYPNNNAANNTTPKGYGILFAGSLVGDASYCNIAISNRGGSATEDISSNGTLTWKSDCQLDGLSDLIVSSVSFVDGTFSAVVKNQATFATPADVPITLKYTVDGDSITSGNSGGSLAAGASVKIGSDGLSHTLTGGTHTITAYADYTNQIVESNEVNNQLSLTLGPDLIVTSLSYSQGIFSSTVKNQDTIATPADKLISVGYYVDGIWQISGSISSPLAAGASVAVGTNGIYTIPDGIHSITAHVNDTKLFAESNEINNKLTQSITVGPLPDVIITSFSYTNGVFSVVVKNQGLGATPAGVTVGVGYSVDGVWKTYGQIIGPLAAGASVTIGTNGSSYLIPVGTHTIYAYVDDINRFPETDESNNDFTKSISIWPTGITDAGGSFSQMSVYPNPAGNVLTIELNGITGKQQVQVFNETGTLVKEIEITGIRQINISDLPAGLYLTRIKNNLIQVQRFIKQ